jgi:hypothetical protein
MKVHSFLRGVVLALVLSATGMAAVAAPRTAPPPPKVATVLSVDKTGKVTPGDILTYTVTLRNDGKGPRHGPGRR